jgi:hypothetical protein
MEGKVSINNTCTEAHCGSTLKQDLKQVFIMLLVKMTMRHRRGVALKTLRSSSALAQGVVQLS